MHLLAFFLNGFNNFGLPGSSDLPHFEEHGQTYAKSEQNLNRSDILNQETIHNTECNVRWVKIVLKI